MLECKSVPGSGGQGSSSGRLGEARWLTWHMHERGQLVVAAVEGLRHAALTSSRLIHGLLASHRHALEDVRNLEVLRARAPAPAQLLRWLALLTLSDAG